MGKRAKRKRGRKNAFLFAPTLLSESLEQANLDCESSPATSTSTNQVVPVTDTSFSGVDLFSENQVHDLMSSTRSSCLIDPVLYSHQIQENLHGATVEFR